MNKKINKNNNKFKLKTKMKKIKKIKKNKKKTKKTKKLIKNK